MANRPYRFIAVIALAAASLSLLAACAGGPRNPSTWHGARVHFNEMDRNGDKVLTRDEINPELALYQEFNRYDADGNGKIELDEFYEYVNARSGQN